MIKFYCLILSCFLVCGGLSAQTDTIRPPAGPPVQADTGHVTVRPDSAVHHLSHRDSVRRDSINRVRRAIRDSLRLVQSKAAADSAAKALAAGTSGDLPPGAARKDSPGGSKDSTVTARQVAASQSSGRVTPPAVAVEAREGPPALSFWQKVLGMNPMFNFTGKPVVEIFEIHRPNSKDSFFLSAGGHPVLFRADPHFFREILQQPHYTLLPGIAPSAADPGTGVTDAIAFFTVEHFIYRQRRTLCLLFASLFTDGRRGSVFGSFICTACCCWGAFIL